MSIEIKIDKTEMPDWRYEPSSLLWVVGQRLEGVEIVHTAEKVTLPPPVGELRERIKETPNFFPGPLVNAEGVHFEKNGIHIETTETDFFSYLAAAYYYRDHQADNPVRPLATQASLLTPQGQLIIERRPFDVADFPGKLSVLGGVMRPEDTGDPAAALRNLLRRRLNLDLTPGQMVATGLGRENVNNVFGIFYLAYLTEEQLKNILATFRQKSLPEYKVLYVVPADQTSGYIERLLQHRDITGWNPLGFDNLIYALAAANLRSVLQIADLLRKSKFHLSKTGRPLQYTYPMEGFLK